jgi:flavin-binding protein dodecin
LAELTDVSVNPSENSALNARPLRRVDNISEFCEEGQRIIPKKEDVMAKKDKSAGSVYKVVEVIGTSTKSWADAGRNAVEAAAGSLRDLRIAEVVKLDMTVEKGKVRAYRARMALSFKYES